MTSEHCMKFKYWCSCIHAHLDLYVKSLVVFRIQWLCFINTTETLGPAKTKVCTLYLYRESFPVLSVESNGRNLGIFFFNYASSATWRKLITRAAKSGLAFGPDEVT